MLLLIRLTWSLEMCVENFPCHQCMTVSNQYAKTSGRTWRIGGSQIRVRTGRDSILCRVYRTHTLKCSRSVTTSTSTHPGKTIPSFFFQYTSKVTNDTDPLMWWKLHQQEFPDLTRMDRQYLTVPVTSVSPERFFSRVGLV
jgi:hypothetical protein